MAKEDSVSVKIESRIVVLTEEAIANIVSERMTQALADAGVGMSFEFTPFTDEANPDAEKENEKHVSDLELALITAQGEVNSLLELCVGSYHAIQSFYSVINQSELHKELTPLIEAWKDLFKNEMVRQAYKLFLIRSGDEESADDVQVRDPASVQLETLVNAIYKRDNELEFERSQVKMYRRYISGSDRVMDQLLITIRAIEVATRPGALYDNDSLHPAASAALKIHKDFINGT